MKHTRPLNRVDPMVGEGMPYGERRRAIVAHCAQLAEELDLVDRQLAELSRRRRDLALELAHQRNRLLPTLRRRGRQPAADGSAQLPPVAARATPLWGRRLRSVCLALLRGAGTLALPELHALLHRHGYRIARREHVKVLADAMGYEVDQGRVRRVNRGVYECIGGPVPPLGRHGNPTLRPLQTPLWLVA